MSFNETDGYEDSAHREKQYAANRTNEKEQAGSTFACGRACKCIVEKQESITNIEKKISGDPEAIYGMDLLYNTCKQAQGITKDSTLDEILTDKKGRIEQLEFVKNLAIAFGAIVLTIASAGTGTLALAALGANFALSTYAVYETIENFKTEKDGYNAGVLSDDPSLLWVVIAIAGAVVDAAALRNAFKVAEPIAVAAKEFNASQRVKLLQEQLSRIKGLDEKISRNIIRSAEAQAKLFSATKRSMQNINMFVDGLGPMAQGIEIAYYGIKSLGLNFERFILKLEASNLIKASKLTRQDIIVLENIFEKSERLAKINDPAFVKELEDALLNKDYATLEKLAERSTEIVKHENDALKISENVKIRGKFKKSSGYHGDTEHKMPDNVVMNVLANPDFIFIAKNKKTLTFLKDGDIVIVDALGSSKGNAITAYGRSGIKGNSGATALGGLPSDPAPAITYQIIVEGKIPSKTGFIPPATQVYP